MICAAYAQTFWSMLFTEYALMLQLLWNVCIFMIHMFMNTPVT